MGCLRTTVVVATLVGSALVACGGTDEPAAPESTAEATSTSTTSTSTSIAAEAPAGPSTDAPTTTAATTTSSSTSTSTTAPSTTVPDGALAAACLQGTWLLDDAATAELHAALLPGFPLVVEGSHQLAFDGDSVEYFVNEVLRFVPSGDDIQIPFDQRSAGTFQIDGDELVLVYSTVEGGVGGADGTVTNENDELTDVAGNFLPPDFALPTVAGGPATCDGDTLTIGMTSGLASAAATFRRI